VEEIGATLSVAPNAMASLQLRDLEQEIALLPEEHRQVILFVGLKGMSYEKVAAILGVRIGTVRSRLSCDHESLSRRMGVRGGTMRGAAREQANTGAASWAA